MASDPFRVTARQYNGPFVTSNATALRVSSNLHVVDNVHATNVHLTRNLDVDDTVSADVVKARELIVSGDLTTKGVYHADHISSSYAFSGITTTGDALEKVADNTNKVYLTNSYKRALHGSIWLGAGSSCLVEHNLDVDANLYTVIATICDTGNTSQIVTPQITEKGPNSFYINCVPENSSSNAMVNFTITELVTAHAIP